MRIRSFVHILVLALGSIMMLSLLASCVPKEKNAQCAKGESFSAALRKCVANPDSSTNHAPSPGADQTIATIEGTSITFDIATATDQDSDVLEYYLVTTPVHGTLYNCLGQVGSYGRQDHSGCLWVPTSSTYAGTDSFTYMVYDGKTYSIHATVTITINAVESPASLSLPASSVGSPFTTYEDESFTVSGIIVDEGGGADEDSQSIQISVTSNSTALIANNDIQIYYDGNEVGTGGAWVPLGDGASSADLAYVGLWIAPVAGAYGQTTLTVKVTDNNGATIVQGTIHVKILDVNFPPEFSAQTVGTITVNENSPQTLAYSYTVNEGTNTDPTEAQQNMWVEVASSNTALIAQNDIVLVYNGGTIGSATGVISLGDGAASANVVNGLKIFYTPTADVVGTSTLTVTIHDGTTTVPDASSIATTSFTVTVLPVNSLPVFVNTSADLAANEDASVPSASFVVDEGGGVDENAQDIYVRVTNDCPVVVPYNNISIRYNGAGHSNDGSNFVNINDGAVSSDAHPIYLDITPAANANDEIALQECGSAVTTFTVEISDDAGANVVTSTFALNLSPINDAPYVTTVPNQATNVATLFWVDTDLTTSDIDGLVINAGGGADENSPAVTEQSVSITITSSNQALVPHNRANIKLYVGSVGSIPAIDQTPDAGGGASPLVYDLGSPDSADRYFLAIHPVAGLTGTANITLKVTDNGWNGVVPVSAPKTTTQTFSVLVSNVSAQHNDWSDVVALGPKTDNAGTTLSSASVTISWNAMSMNNDTLNGYHVYRALYPSDGLPTSTNFVQLTSTPLSADTLTFEDLSITNNDVGKMYFYKVKPIGTTNTIPTDTSQSYSVVRVIVPPANMAFVSRRIANAEMCGKMSKTSDKLKYNRCSYTGPGAIYDVATAQSYYDLGKDYLVDRFEAGCRYTQNPGVECTETGNGCIGTSGKFDLLANEVTATNGSVYYERDTAKCYLRVAGAWSEMSSLDVGGGEVGAFSSILPNVSHLPPLTQVTQAQANKYCRSSSVTLKRYDPVGGSETTVAPAPTRQLMTRKAQIAASAWKSTTTNISAYEAGASLASSVSQCNSSNGGTLGFVDDEVPPPETAGITDTLPGTFSSTVRSLRTGSDATVSCVSRYGIQDLIGNVREWTSDRIYCPAFDGCFPIYSTEPTTAAFMLPGAQNDFLYSNSSASYVMADINGSLVGDEGPGVGGTNLTGWAMESKLLSADYVYLPMGLPATAEAVGVASASAIPVTSSLMNGDYIYFGADLVMPTVRQIAGMTTGGSYASGVLTDPNPRSATDAGRFNGEFHANDGGAEEVTEDTGFRCMVPVSYP